ncbi:hypothetical protein [Natronogracilivirgula saccharolytica]|uniref:Uncharacterized protein n=1 Tax=Natronogracilivirga saccharolytica TaxID=2812953 RepID=A0A8J7UU63_9BACT|nr:hypothetical protein [Natronogracilivirga saccharolytica]
MPIVDGTRTTVRTITGYCQMGMDVDHFVHTSASITCPGLLYFCDEIRVLRAAHCFFSI